MSGDVTLIRGPTLAGKAKSHIRGRSDSVGGGKTRRDFMKTHTFPGSVNL